VIPNPDAVVKKQQDRRKNKIKGLETMMTGQRVSWSKWILSA